MIFTNIRLQNFRSYSDESFEIGSGVNVVVGPNGAGKTNLLEALMVIASGKSYRAKDQALVMRSKDWSRLDVYSEDNKNRVVKITNENFVNKVFEIDGKVYKKLPKDYIQPVVLFEPDDLYLLSSEPASRRDFLDNIIEKYDQNYYKIRQDYRRVVAQRNALLKQNSDSSEMFAWNVRMSNLASIVVEARTKLIYEFNQKISDIYSFIADKPTSICLVYKTKTPLTAYASALVGQLEEQLNIDKIRGYTSRGPHRDDIEFFNDEAIFSDVASRGENRTLMLALKIIELQILEAKTGKRPLLLLDDVFSELDGSRRKSLTNYLKDYQTIITTTDADIIMKNFTKSTSTILL